MRTILTISLLLPALAVSAEVWTAVDCPSDHAQERAAFKERLLAAQPGDPLYLPFPFPKTDEQAVRDFLYGHRRVIDFQERPPSDDERLFETTDSNNARFVVSKVANWSLNRCGPRQQIDFYFLIRVFDKRSEEEITRAVIAQSGQVFQLVHRPANKEDAAFTMSELMKLQLPSSLGRASGAQYVDFTGPSVRCPALKPCIAFKSGGQTYLAVRNRFYRLHTQQPISFRENFGQPEARAAFLQKLEGREDIVVSLGGDRMAFATPLNK